MRCLSARLCSLGRVEQPVREESRLVSFNLRSACELRIPDPVVTQSKQKAEDATVPRREVVDSHCGEGTRKMRGRKERLVLLLFIVVNAALHMLSAMGSRNREARRLTAV